MKRIDFDNLAAWCHEHGYELQEWKPVLPGCRKQVELALPNEIQNLPELIDDLVTFESAGSEWLVWIRDWTIWNDRSQEVGLRHLDLLVGTACADDVKTLGHIYLLQESEWRETMALLTLPILYGWDAHLFYRSGAALVDVSPHGQIRVSLQNEEEALRLDSWF
jgi:hypothetical protein